MADLRARRHRETKGELFEAGLRLFEANGYDAVTMEQIASAADVSRRTLYRHFPTKDRILLDLPLQWLAMWDDAVGELPPQSPPQEVIEHATRLIGAHLDTDSERIRVAWRIIDANPSLEPSFLANPTWTDRLVDLLTDDERGAPFDPADAVVVAGAYLGAIDASMLHWAANRGAHTVVDAVERIIARLAPIWRTPAGRGRR